MKIKNIMRFFLPVIAGAMVATSCHGDLNIMQDNKLSASNMWQDATDVKQSTYGIYQRMRSCFVSGTCNVFYWGEVRVGTYMWGSSIVNLAHDNDMIGVESSTMNGANSSTNWSALYSTIDQANAVLKYASIVTMSDKDRSFAIGQASFARAYCYFWAARLWGDVPLNLVPIESVSQPECYPVRAPKAEVYAQIGKDIETALENSANLGSDCYFATRTAVNILKAEYALWMYTNQQGGDSYLTLAKEAIDALDLTNNALLSDYSQVFSNSNKKNKEMVFALSNSQAEGLTGGFYPNFWLGNSSVAAAYQNNPVPMKSTQWWGFQPTFMSRLRESRDAKGDSRVPTNLGDGDYGANGQNLTWCNKYVGDQSGAIAIEDCDIPYYRAALGIMLAAEYEYYKKNYTQALAYLNVIAKRAYKKDNYYTDATQAGVLAALENEYFLEFPAEGVIWWALIRLDTIWNYNNYLKEQKAKNPNILLWPISNSARQKNYKLTQTPGWN
ncbi:MAG: RagB/SusD family nutrient uptake outer membrane protein [Alistipes sp.]|nr:RagB/SusD family nutrient uptake outer membrane protein [Alistipes sp.]